MPERLRPVFLFGTAYCWHREPGQPLELVSLRVLPARPPEELAELAARLMGRPLPGPEKEEPSA